MPSTPLTCCSIGSATVTTTARAPAPGYRVVTEMVGGTTLGYCATGSFISATAPMTTMRMASTFARTGRSMKKFRDHDAALFRCGRIRVSRLGRLQLRVDFLAGDGIENAGDNNALLRLQP